MATLELTATEIVEARARVDTRAKDRDLPDSLLQGDLTLGVATDWAWSEARLNRVDAVGMTDDFDTFLAGLSVRENLYFRRAVLNRLAGIVAGSYRKLKLQDAGGIRQDYTPGQTVEQLFASSEAEIGRLRDAAPPGVYSKANLFTLIAGVGGW